MKFFNIDLHISVIEDIKTIFNDLGHQVDSKCLSHHTWVFNRTTDKVDVIGQHNWHDISPEMCDAFYERYKDELSGYDGFIVTHTPCFALLYEKFNKPIITVASTRYEAPFTTNKNQWNKFDNFLRDKIDQGIVIPITNNLYDKKYTEHFTQREWQFIPSLCEYTKLKYTGTKDDLILYSKCKDINLPNVIKKQNIQDSSWESIYSHKGIIHIPYNISTMSIFEQKTAGIPLLFPSLDYLLKIQGNLGELFYGGIQEIGEPPHNTDCEFWRSKENVQLADFFQWKEVLRFDSEEHLSQLLEIVDFQKMSQRSLEENKIIKKETYEKWNKVLSDIQKPIIINNKNLIKHVESCFEKANLNQSKVTDEILKLDGMTGKRTRHFYNNICSMNDARYLEVGTWKGSSVCAAMHQNDNLSCVCIDNWSEFGGPKIEFLENFNKFKGNSNSRFIEKNCWDVDITKLGKFNIYMYDGNHSEDSHFKALNYFSDCLDDEFIYLIDDWNWDKVRRGTLNSIKKNNFKILFKKEIRTTEGIHDEEIHAQPHGPKSDWHNGIAVFVLKKNNNAKQTISNVTFGILTSGRKEPDTPGATVSVRSSDSAQSLLKTWGKDVSNIYFATDVIEQDERFIKCSDRNDYSSTGEKQINLCLHMYKNCPATEWYVLADDDTYMYTDNLLELLENFNSEKPIALGRLINYSPDRSLLYHSGGAGMVFNRAAFEKICEFFLIKENYNHHTKNQIYGDVAIGYAYRYFNITPINCDAFFGRAPEQVQSDQLVCSKSLKKDFPDVQDVYSDKVISYHSIDAKRCIEESWENFKYMKDVCGNTKLTLLISSRNDSYNGDSVGRLRQSLRYNSKVLKGKPAEIIVTDWGSDVPLSEEFKNEKFSESIVKFNYIPKEQTNKIDSDFPEVLCLNSGANKAKGQFIGRIDQDTLIGQNFIDWIFGEEPNEENFYFSTRRDMKLGQLSVSPNDVEHNPCDRSNFNEFWKCAVGILLVPKKSWNEIGGYNEKNIWINHMEHEFVVRLNKILKLIDLGPIIDYDFYHIYHDRNTLNQRKTNDFTALSLSSDIELKPN